MKKSVEILGLSVVSISEGKELGTVKDFIINPAGGIVAALVIDDGNWYLGAKLLPFSAVAGVGENAVTVETSEHIFPVTSAPELEKLLVANVKVIGTKVLTKSGRIQGKVTEIVIDETGKIALCEIEEVNGELTNIPAQRVITFGKDVLIVANSEDEAGESAASPVPNKTYASTKPTRPVEENTAAAVTPAPAPAISTSQPSPVAAPEPELTPTPAVAAATATTTQASAEDLAKKFDDKHRKYLLGKKAGRRIETDNGLLIVEEGGEITEEVLQKAKLAGKFVELSMNIQ